MSQSIKVGLCQINPILGDFDYNNPSFINKAKFEKLVLDSNVKYLGYHNNVKKYIVDADVVVLPSFREGLPKSLLEAASCKLPLVATDVPGGREVCKNNFIGILIQKKDSKVQRSWENSCEGTTSNERLS